MVEITETLYITERDDWRAWLEENHDSAKEIWLVFYKKHTGKPRLPQDDAVEEALCFGWIDSIVKRIDDEKFVQRFTPRRVRSIWSESNRERVGRMIEAGKMTAAGMAKVEAAKKNGKWFEYVPVRGEIALPKWIEKELRSEKKVWENFNSMAPSHRKQYLWWIMSAKREDTRIRRLKHTMERVAQNKKPGM